jgi:hypothetical protein
LWLASVASSDARLPDLPCPLRGDEKLPGERDCSPGSFPVYTGGSFLRGCTRLFSLLPSTDSVLKPLRRHSFPLHAVASPNSSKTNSRTSASACWLTTALSAPFLRPPSLQPPERCAPVSSLCRLPYHQRHRDSAFGLCLRDLRREARKPLQPSPERIVTDACRTDGRCSGRAVPEAFTDSPCPTGTVFCRSGHRSPSWRSSRACA